MNIRSFRKCPSTSHPGVEVKMTDDLESLHIWLAKGLNGPLLNDNAVVEAFAALILKRLYGESELARQQPLQANDMGADWVVMGSHQEPSRLPGTGAWFIRVRKSDCRVEKFGHYEPLDIPDDVKEMIAKAKASREPC
jgi:hypothetical protein